jgi:hypothetical protein
MSAVISGVFGRIDLSDEAFKKFMGGGHGGHAGTFEVILF